MLYYIPENTIFEQFKIQLIYCKVRKHFLNIYNISIILYNSKKFQSAIQKISHKWYMNKSVHILANYVKLLEK